MQGLEVIEATLAHSTIQYAEKTEPLKQRIHDGQVVILKGCFDANQLLTLKHSVHRWGQQHTVFAKGQSASISNLNFHRIDGSDIPTKLPHCFHQYGFGELDALDNDLRLLLYQVAKPLLTLQNSMAGTQYKLSDQLVRVKVLHYPRGGGYLANHIHPLHPQRVGLIASLSDWEIDYKQGGNVFYSTQYGEMNTSPHHHIGDVLLFRYDIPHEIKAIDPQQQIEWDSLSGKWSLVLELLETNAQSEAVPGVK